MEAWMTGGRNRRDETHSAMTMYCMALSSVALAATPGAAAADAGAGASFFAAFFFFGGIPSHGVWGRPARPDTAPNSGFRPLRDGTRAELVSHLNRSPHSRVFSTHGPASSNTARNGISLRFDRLNFGSRGPRFENCPPPVPPDCLPPRGVFDIFWVTTRRIASTRRKTNFEVKFFEKQHGKAYISI